MRVRWYNPLALITVVGILIRWMWVLTRWGLFGPFIFLAWLEKR